jgi:hypothetical protein
MPDNRIYSASAVRKLAPSQDQHAGPVDISRGSVAAGTAQEAKYFAVSPKGTHLEIPKELFIALSDFLETRKYPGAISIQFRSGEIICIEAAAKKRYR